MSSNFSFLDQVNDKFHYSVESINERMHWDPDRKKFIGPKPKDGPTFVEIKLPVDSERDFKGCSSLNERRERMEAGEVEYISLFINPTYENNPDKYSDGWIWVKLPEEIDGVRYIPIIIFNAGGIGFYPGTHKYFLRSFDKRTRHLILGFCLEHGEPIIRLCYYAAGKHGMFQPDHLFYLERISINYKDSDAPKRIDIGPKYDEKYEKYHPSVADYKRWLKDLEEFNNK